MAKRVSAASAACKLLETLIFSCLPLPWCNSTAVKLMQACRRGRKFTTGSLGSFSLQPWSGKVLAASQNPGQDRELFPFSLVKRLFPWEKADWTDIARHICSGTSDCEFPGALKIDTFGNPRGEKAALGDRCC